MSSRQPLKDFEIEDLDLGDPGLHAEYDLRQVWQQLRDRTPVSWRESASLGCGFWAVTGYANAVDVYRNTADFSSERGNVLDVLSTGPDPAGGQMLALTDGNPHSDLRRILLRAFTPRALDLVVRRMRVATRRLLHDAAEKGNFDFARDVAALIPLAAVCDLLRVPVSDREYILRLTSSALASDQGVPHFADTWNAKAEILLYFSQLVRFRRQHQDDDIVSMLVSCEVAGRKLTDEEIVFNCYSIVMGGDETTRLSMVGGVLALIENPDQWQSLRNGDVDVSVATEEILRWTTPAIHGARTATRDLEYRGANIKSGDIVIVWNVSANMDDTQFPDPGNFELARRPNRHVTFSYGPHFCIGAYMSRQEIAAVLESLRRSCLEITLAGTPRVIYSNYLQGYCGLPVSVAQ
jgi:cytochrome P450